ncbi:hypothetical protein ABZT06_28030 [Streptomyces sp. NPDC005483]|uniref:hypothetical protein n=1 Tax=Streptomyces sp. NPDC005483 TaxID=3154882 RepID=UPI0033BAEAAA
MLSVSWEGGARWPTSPIVLIRVGAMAMPAMKSIPASAARSGASNSGVIVTAIAQTLTQQPPRDRPRGLIGPKTAPARPEPNA